MLKSFLLSVITSAGQEIGRDVAGRLVKRLSNTPASAETCRGCGGALRAVGQSRAWCPKCGSLWAGCEAQ